MATLSAKGAETKYRIVRAAAELFHKQGLHATSPEDIIEASGTGKGQFYHYFKNKEGLVHEVLAWHLSQIHAGDAPINYDIETWRDLEAWFTAHIELQKTFGMTRACPFGTAANEITENDEPIRQDLKLIFDVIRGNLVQFFLREKARGRLVPTVDEQRLASFCIAAVQGAMLLGKVNRDDLCAQAIVHEALAHVQHYVVKDNGDKDDPL